MLETLAGSERKCLFFRCSYPSVTSLKASCWNLCCSCPQKVRCIGTYMYMYHGVEGIPNEWNDLTSFPLNCTSIEMVNQELNHNYMGQVESLYITERNVTSWAPIVCVIGNTGILIWIKKVLHLVEWYGRCMATRLSKSLTACFEWLWCNAYFIISRYMYL